MFHKFRVSRTNYALEGYVSIFVEIFVVSHSRKTSWVNLFLLCFGNFPVAKKFMDKRGGYQYFQSEFFLSHSAKKFCIGTLLCYVSETNGSEKDNGEVGRVKILPGKFTVSQCRKFS